jgi:cytochrome c oxidase assembly factor CtaG
MNAPPLTTLVWTHWNVSWGVDVLGGLAAFAYVTAAGRVRRGWPAWRTASFVLGVIVVLVALQSGLDTFDGELLSAHMVQHLLLIEVAPLLLLGGAPVLLALRTLPPARRPAAARRLRTVMRALGPVTCLVAYSAVVLGTHVPAVANAAVRHPALHELEHAAYLAAGVLLWWPLLDGDPVASRRLPGLGRFVYVIAAMAPMELIGAYLNRHGTVVFDVYAAPARALGISPVIDQQHAGAIMWAGSGMIMTIAGVWQALSAMIAAERRQQARERRLDARLAGGPGEVT